MAEVRIHLCGRLTVALDGRRVEEQLPGRQGRLLLAYLVVNRTQSCARDEIVDAIWSDEPPGRVDAALSALLSKLRRIFGAGAFEGRHALRLVLPAEAWVDVESALDGLHRAEAAVARRAYDEAWGPARLAQHIAMRPFLAGEERDWIDEVRRRLEEIRHRALELVGNLRSRWPERSSRRPSERRGASSRRREDLGLAPGPETTAVYERVLRRAAG